jgi:signal transduction histidine kinase
MLRFRFRRPTQHPLQTNGWFDWFAAELPAEKQSEISGALHFGFLILGVFLLLHSPAAGQVKPLRRVIIVHQTGAYEPLADYVDRGIRAAFDSSPYRIESHREFMEPTFFPDSSEQLLIREFYAKKYENRRPDLIITVGPAPLQLMIETHSRSFPGVPIVFCLPDRIPGGFPVDSDFTGVAGDIAPAETLAAALRLRPGTKHVVVIVGRGSIDLDRKAAIKNQLKSYENRLDISYLTGLTETDLVERVKHLPSDTIILLHGLGLDAAGNLFTTAESGAIVAANSNAPVFSLIDRSLSHGEVGGDVSDAVEQGRIAGTIAVRILNGEKPQNIPVVKNVTTYMFDWRALKRWGMKESDLPPGSTVLFREPSLWERGKRILISGFLIIVVLAALTAYLLYSRTQLKLARDTQVRLSGLLIDAQERERSRLAAELHDDFSQRVALLVFGLRDAQEALSTSSNGVDQKLEKLKETVRELGDDLHATSHRLHSATLDKLGLVSGLRAMCREFSGGQGIQIAFLSEDVPAHISPDVALCLFRIVQEALQNLKKHSGAEKAEVRLRKSDEKLFLTVRDEGKGFDAREMGEKLGLGIGSMQGRARLLGGEFEIHSELGKGTRIEVWVPLLSDDVLPLPSG